MPRSPSSSLGWTPESAETPPCSWTTTWLIRWTRISSPRRVWARTAAWFPIVPDGTYTAASLPRTRAVSASSAITVGSSPQTSSPTSASAIARRISGVGRVTVSERRSTGRIARQSILPAVPRRAADYPPPVRVREFVAAPEAGEDERIDVGVLFVGGGPAGMAGAIRLGQLLAQDPATAEALGETPIAVIDKGRVA